MNRRGFSLIELLVVVGAVAVIAAILAPVYSSARHSARRARCQSNLRQIGGAMEAYTSDYSGFYPNLKELPDGKPTQYLWGGFYWRDPVSKYTAAGDTSGRDTVFSCPSDPTPPGVYAGTSYAYSACFYITPNQVNAIPDCNLLRVKLYSKSSPVFVCGGVAVGDVRFKSRKVVVTEYFTLHSSRKVGWYDDADTGNDPWSGSRNYLFADGHVVYLATRRIREAASPLVARPRLLPDINLTTNGAAGKDVD